MAENFNSSNPILMNATLVSPQGLICDDTDQFHSFYPSSKALTEMTLPVDRCYDIWGAFITDRNG